jgi:PadR family transcriptional regulator PadR
MEKKLDALGPFEQLVLTAVFTLGDDAYGVTIHSKVSELAEKNANLGSIYITLDRLSDKGLVRSWEAKPSAERRGKLKRFYKLESAGLEALKESLATSSRMNEAFEETRRVRKWRSKRATT